MGQYKNTFTTNAFQPDEASGKYKMTLTADTLNLGGGFNIRLSKLFRSYGGHYENVIESYEVDTGGNMYIYSDQPFSGKIVVTSE